MDEIEDRSNLLCKPLKTTAVILRLVAPLTAAMLTNSDKFGSGNNDDILTKPSVGHEAGGGITVVPE
jgi:hypothetical protein